MWSKKKKAVLKSHSVQVEYGAEFAWVLMYTNLSNTQNKIELVF